MRNKEWGYLPNVEGGIANQKNSPSNDTVNIPNEKTEQKCIKNLFPKKWAKLKQVQPESVMYLNLHWIRCY